MQSVIKFLLPTALVAVTLSHKECFSSLQKRPKAVLFISTACKLSRDAIGSRGLVPFGYGIDIDSAHTGTVAWERGFHGTAVNLNKERTVSEYSRLYVAKHAKSCEVIYVTHAYIPECG